VFLLTSEDKKRYPELRGERILALWESPFGFVRAFTWDGATKEGKRAIADELDRPEWLEED